MNLDKRLLAAVRPVAGLLLLAVFFGLAAGVLAVLQARSLSQVLASVFLGRQGLAEAMPLMLAFLGIILLRCAAGFLSDWLSTGLAARVKIQLRERIFRQVLALGPARVTASAAGDLLATGLQGVEALDAYFSQYLPQVALAGLVPLTVLLFVFPLDPLSALILLLTGPLIPFFMFLIGSNAEKLTMKQFAALGRMSAVLLDTLQGLKTLKALGRSREQAGHIATVSERYRVVTMEILRLTFLSALALEWLGTLSTAVIAVQIGLRLLYGRLPFEESFFILVIAPDFYQPLRNLGLRFHASRNGIAAANRIFAFLAGEGEGRQAQSPCQPPVDWAEIVFENVAFQYPDRDLPALDGCSFRLRRGERVALVGASGAGKTTTANLLLRFLDPDSGRILVDGCDLSTILAADWRRQIGWVPQNAHLFAGSLAENLRIAKEEALDADLWSALEQAHLADWVRAQPDGLATRIGEGGARLSGGQGQRLALARAFLRDSPLLVLDEPTAHLDPAEEALLEAATERLCQGRTVLVIAHRLATVYRSDRILLLDAGQVRETGTHAELVARSGAYARLVAAYGGGR